MAPSGPGGVPMNLHRFMRVLILAGISALCVCVTGGLLVDFQKSGGPIALLVPVGFGIFLWWEYARLVVAADAFEMPLRFLAADRGGVCVRTGSVFPELRVEHRRGGQRARLEV